METQSKNGITHLKSRHSAADVLEKLLAFLPSKSITVFAVIDHSGEAAKSGLTMPDTKVVIFGKPEAGTPLMQAVPDIALDLPLKILIAENSDGTTTVAYNSVKYLQDRYDLAPDLTAKIASIEQIAAAIAL